MAMSDASHLLHSEDEMGIVLANTVNYVVVARCT